MLTYLILTVGAMAYTFAAGVARTTINNKLTEGCWRNHHSAECFHMTAAFVVALIWPVALVFLMGASLPELEYTPRRERKRMRELAEADHKIALAEKNAEAVAIAERSVNIS